MIGSIIIIILILLNLYTNILTQQTQTILQSSGSGGETLWDLRLVQVQMELVHLLNLD